MRLSAQANHQSGGYKLTGQISACGVTTGGSACTDVPARPRMSAEKPPPPDDLFRFRRAKANPKVLS